MTEKDRRSIEIVRLMYTGDDTERANIASDIVWHLPGHNPVPAIITAARLGLYR